jgi:hypothetical protein
VTLINMSMSEKPPDPPFGNIVAMLFAAAVILLACFMTVSRACSSLDDTQSDSGAAP